MQMQGSRELIVSQQIAWDALNDPEVLKACIPGCDRVELSGDNQYNIGMALKIGPVSAKFTGVINLLDVEAPRSYRIKFEGQGGPAGFGKGESKVVLEPTATGCLLVSSTYTRVLATGLPIGGRGIHRAGSPSRVKAVTTWVSEGPYWLCRRASPRTLNICRMTGVTCSCSPATMTSLTL